MAAINVWPRNCSLSTIDQCWIRLEATSDRVSTPGATQRDNNSTVCCRILAATVGAVVAHRDHQQVGTRTIGRLYAARGQPDATSTAGPGVRSRVIQASSLSTRPAAIRAILNYGIYLTERIEPREGPAPSRAAMRSRCSGVSGGDESTTARTCSASTAAALSWVAGSISGAVAVGRACSALLRVLVVLSRCFEWFGLSVRYFLLSLGDNEGGWGFRCALVPIFASGC
jgi:hypothetical protein